MGLKIVWSPRALEGFDQIVLYLERNWTEKEVSAFVKQTTHFLELLSENPRILQRCSNKINLYRGPINRLTILTYRINRRRSIIELVNIRPAKQESSDE